MTQPRADASRPLVIKLGGLAVDSPERAGPLLAAIARIHRAAQPGVVLVHGGGKAVDEHLAKLSIQTERREGLRVTGDREIGEVVAVLAGKVNKAVVGALQAAGAAAVGLCLGDGQMTRAQRYAPSGVDLGHVGEVVGGDPRLLRILLAEGFMPVVGPIALDDSGRPLNVNADDAAAAVAGIIRARGLVLLTDVPGVLDEQRALIPSLTAAQVDELIARGVISGGMIPKVRAALRAAQLAAVPTIIASWDDPAAIERIAAGSGAGTRFDPLGPTSDPDAEPRPESSPS
ncbi:MAG: acetylglutamate kinase [Planctomycetota bacterium]|nr:acetylglutamate kinase [Planctomycetota bacterium]